MYTQNKVEEYSNDVFNKLEGGAHMYFCGLKGMMPRILDMLAGVCESKGIGDRDYPLPRLCASPLL